MRGCMLKQAPGVDAVEFGEDCNYQIAEEYEMYDPETETVFPYPNTTGATTAAAASPAASSKRAGQGRDAGECVDSTGNDIDSGSYHHRGSDQAKKEHLHHPGSDQRISSGDILTLTMVWTNVYGLGIACFFLSYITTMASPLSTYSFIVSLSALSIYEAVQERRFPMERQWNVGRASGQLRTALHSGVLVLCLIGMCIIGVHVSDVHRGMVGRIKVEDVFLGILGPISTPLLLKAVRRPHTTIVGTLETSAPFTFFMAITFMATAMALGMRPYESPQAVARNVVAATILMPAAWGGSIVLILHCVFRRRLLYVLAVCMVVSTGREFTLHKRNAHVIASLLFSIVAFILATIASSNKSIRWLAKKLSVVVEDSALPSTASTTKP